MQISEMHLQKLQFSIGQIFYHNIFRDYAACLLCQLHKL